MAEFMED
jgi:septal ring factor EnvC (AmiA/AmiB activator)